MKEIEFTKFFTLPFTKFLTLHEVIDCCGDKILYVYFDENNHPIVDIKNKEK